MSMPASGANLIWDSDGTATPAIVDGPGIWDHSGLVWYNASTATNVTFTDGDDVRFGNLSAGFTNGNFLAIDISEAVAPNNVVVATTNSGAVTGTSYNFSDFSGGSFTLGGDFTKAVGGGVINILMPTNGFTLSPNALGHSFIMRDTGGDAAEITMNSVVKGSGDLIIDNQVYESWGTLGFTQANTYTGNTILLKGRLAITDSNGLGATSAGTTIGDDGTLAFGGAGLTVTGPLTIAEPITITRSDYDSDQDHRNYGAAIQNVAVSTTITGPLTLNTADARFRVDHNNLAGTGDSKLSIAQNLTTAGKISVVGGGNGVLELTGDNTAVAGGFNIRDGTLAVANQNAIGGPNSKITFGNEAAAPGGGGYLRVVGGFMTDFGTHDVNYATFSGGLDLPDASQVFNITQNLGSDAAPAGQIVKRGLGTLNLSGTNVMNGANWIDKGVVNIKAGTSTGTGGLRMRNSTLNIEAGATYTVRNNNYSSVAIDSGENSTVNVYGSLIQTNADFNVSDLANTTGTVNLFSGGYVETAGITFIGKNAGSTGTINQTGGQWKVTRTGDFGFVLGSRNGTGIYNLSGGTMNCAGQFYVGQGNGTASFGTGQFNMSGASTVMNITNWFVLGREGAAGTFNLTDGAIVNKSGGGGTEVDVGGQHGDATPSTMVVDNAQYLATTGYFGVGVGSTLANGSLTIKNGGKVIVSAGNIQLGDNGTATVLVDNGTFTSSGEFFISNNGGTATLTVRNGSTISANNWMQVGRLGGTGTLNLEGGTVTKSGGGNFYVGENANQNSVLNMSGGALTINSGEFWLGNAGSSKGTMNLSGGTLTVNSWLALGRNGTAQGVLNMTGGSIVKNANGTSRFVIGSGATAVGTLTQSAGSITSNLTSVGESGSGTANLSGGTANLGGLIVKDGGPSGTLNISGTAAVTATTVVMGNSGAGTSKIALSGGSFKATSIAPGASTGTITFDFTGGNLTTNSFSLVTPLASTGTGTLLPGGAAAVGATAITGGYAQAATAALAIDLQDASTFDSVTSPAALTLDGQLQLNLLSGYDPVKLTPHAIMTGSAVTGIFSSVTGVPLTSTKALAVTYTATQVLVTAATPGDANLDGAVNFTDLLSLAANYSLSGKSWTNGDFDGNNTVNFSDLLSLAANYGSTSSVTGSFAGDWALAQSMVPEPTTATLVVGLAGLAATRRRR
ncbi:MAG: hypothetical protein QM770_09695 [Tepidisphaeraceae bacterium]